MGFFGAADQSTPRPSVTRSERGFTLIEAIVAVALLVAVAGGIALSLGRGAKSVMNIQKTNKAKLLADMVFEQYNSRQSSGNMATYNQPTPMSAGAFFLTPDNLGFDGFLLTTNANCSNISINCDVTAVISWQDGGDKKSKTFVKTFSTSTGSKTGATVDVWVKTACAEAGPGFARADVISKCDGIAGFEVTAPPADGYVSYRGKAEVIGYTLQDGHAVLRNVKIANVGVTARKPGSPVNGDLIGYSQGYYYPGPTGPVSSITTTQPTSQTGPNTFLFTDFKPLGSITGVVKMSDGTVPPRRGLVITQPGKRGSTGWGLSSIPAVLAAPSGAYSFYNVVPTSIDVAFLGDPGSHPSVGPADGSTYFRTGLSGGPGSKGTALLPVPPETKSPTPTATLDLTAYTPGWLDITLQNQDGTAVTGPDVFVKTMMGTSYFYDRSEVPDTLVGNASTGHIAFYNVFHQTNYVRVAAWKLPTAVDPGGFAYSDPITCDTGQGCFVTLKLSPNYWLNGTISGVSSNAKVSVMTVDETLAIANVAGSGAFSLSGFSPYFPSVPSQTTPDSILEAGTFTMSNVMLSIKDPSAPLALATTFSGKVLDLLTDDPIEGAAVTAEDGAGNTVTDAGGNFLLTVPALKLRQNVLAHLTCDATPSVRACNVDTADTTLDPAMHMTRITASYAGYRFTPASAATAGGGVSGLVVHGYMMRYPVAGQVTDSITTRPLGHIEVCGITAQSGGTHVDFTKENESLCTFTDSAGNYQLNIPVTGRTKNDGLGFLHPIVFPNQKDQDKQLTYDGYGDHGADLSHIAISPSDLAHTPQTPKTLNIPLDRIQGSL